MCAEEIKFRLKTEAGLSLKDFAKSIGCHPSTVSMVIHRRRKSGPIMEKIGRALTIARDQSEKHTAIKESTK